MDTTTSNTRVKAEKSQCPPRKSCFVFIDNSKLLQDIRWNERGQKILHVKSPTLRAAN